MSSNSLNNTMTQVVNSNSASLSWISYVDVYEDVLPWLQIPQSPSLSTLDMTKMQLLTDMTCQFVQKKLGRPLAPTAFWRRFDGWNGWNGAYLLLPYSPVLQVQKVTEWWGISGPHDLAEQTPEHDIDGFTCDYHTGRMTRVFPGLVQKPWFPGSGNIDIQWVAGYNPIPADWKVATLEMIAHWWRNTQESQRINVRGGPGDDAEAVANGLWEGVPLRIAALLDSGQQIGIG
jgi:hypothetical protein